MALQLCTENGMEPRYAQVWKVVQMSLLLLERNTPEVVIWALPLPKLLPWPQLLAFLLEHDGTRKRLEVLPK